MTPYEILSLVVAVIALVVSGVSIYMARQSNYLAGQSNKTSIASIEFVMNERLTATKERVSDLALSMAPLLAKDNRTAEDERMLEIYEHNFKLALENNLNTYEEICAKYLDGKVDRERFIRTYKREVRQLVENQEFKERFDGVTSPYKAILKVYDEWENLEK